MARSGKSQTKAIELLIMNYQKNQNVNVAQIEQNVGEDFDFTI